MADQPNIPHYKPPSADYQRSGLEVFSVQCPTGLPVLRPVDVGALERRVKELEAENERLRLLNSAALRFISDRLYHGSGDPSGLEHVRELLGGVVESGERR